MEFINNTPCISYAELTAGIMTPDALNYYRRNGSLTQVQRGGNGRVALYAVESLPPKYKVEAYRRYPVLTERPEKTLVEIIGMDGAAFSFFSAWTFDDGKMLSGEVVTEYANNASILNHYRDLIDTANSYRGRLGDKRLPITKFWKEKAAELPEISAQVPNTLPTYYKNLQRLYNRYIIEGYGALISGKYNNVNAAKIKDPQQEAAIVRLLGDHRNIDNEQVATIYNFIAEQMNWEPITGRAVGYLREKHALTISAATGGINEFYNNRAMQVKRKRPTAPLLYWTADGWDVELYYQRTHENKKGHNTTTYGNRLTVCVVLDPFTNYPVGYAIGDHETPELISEAMRNAIDHTRELFGARYRTNQLQTDHYALKNLSPLYCAVADKVTPARVKNAKAKVVEPYFNYLNKKYFQLLPNWSGHNVTARKENQPNADYLNAIRHSFPTVEGCHAQIVSVMEMERQQKRAEYMAGFGSIPADRLLQMTDEMYLLTFGRETGQKNALEGNGLTPRINGIKRAYDCFNPQFREYAHLRWNVKYDPADLTKVLAVSDDGTLRFLLESKYEQPMALVEQQAGDGAELAKINAFNKSLVQTVTNRLAIAAETTERLVLENPALSNSYAKAIICDSNGQHKNQRNRKRLAAETVNFEEIEVKTVPARTKAADKDAETFDLY